MYKKALAVSLAILVCGCSALKTNKYTDVSVKCNPENSIASVNGIHKESPAVFSVVTNKDIDVSCQKPGFITSTTKVRTHITTTGVLDAIGGFFFLFPALGLISPGAWDLDQKDLEISLVESPK